MRLRQIYLPGAAMLVLTACYPEANTDAVSKQTPIRTVRTEVVTMANPVTIRDYPAVLEPAQITPLAFDVGGRLGTVSLQIGQEVRAGDVLATVENHDANLRLQQAEAALTEALAAARNAQDEADRQAQLFERDVASVAARDRAQAGAEQAQARVAQQEQALALLRETLSDTVLRAPFDGFVNTIDVQNYGTVAAGQPVVTLYQETGLTATILVSYDVAAGLSLGQSVTVTPRDGATDTLSATVTEIASRAPTVSSFPIVITLDEMRPDLRPGMAVDVAIARALPDDLRGISVPLTALLTQRPATLSGPGLRSAEVFVFEQGTTATGTVQPRRVQIGTALEDRVVLIDGLDPGDRIVTAGVPFLHPGQEVRLEGIEALLIAEALQ